MPVFNLCWGWLDFTELCIFEDSFNFFSAEDSEEYELGDNGICVYGITETELMIDYFPILLLSFCIY
jgi:hypothetical protein